MACSSQGVPLNYSAPSQSPCSDFYWQPQNPDPYQNAQSMSYQQLFQLNRTSLMPRSWGAAGAACAPCAPSNPCDGTSGDRDWYAYAPTPAKFQQYIQSQGAARIQQQSRNPISKLGSTLLLRSTPPVPLTAECSPWFSNSSYRADLISSLGCGANPACTY